MQSLLISCNSVSVGLVSTKCSEASEEFARYNKRSLPGATWGLVHGVTSPRRGF